MSASNDREVNGKAPAAMMARHFDKRGDESKNE